jgi:Zn-dependent oligopeptidase
LGLSLLFGESSKRKYDLDQNVKERNWKTSEKVCLGCCELFDLQFKQITNVPVYADVRVWEVSIKRGKLVGLWYFDRMPEKENVLAPG